MWKNIPPHRAERHFNGTACRRLGSLVRLCNHFGKGCRETTRIASNHRDTSRSNEFGDPEGSNPFDERLDFIFASADFDHELVGSHVDDATTKNVDEFSNLTSLSTTGGLDLHQQQVSFDEVAGTDVDDTNDGDDLFQLFSDLLQDAIVTDDYEGHPREFLVFRFTDRERVDVVATRGKHPRNMGEYPGNVLHERGENVSLGGAGHQAVILPWEEGETETVYNIVLTGSSDKAALTPVMLAP